MVQEEMIKGRIAEAIVRCMFEDLAFEVIPYGYEHTCPTIANKKRLIKGCVKDHIRKAPDFIIVDNEGNANFIEVKYRKNGIFKKEGDYPFQDCYIILLSDKYMGIEQYKNLKDEATMKSSDFWGLPPPDAAFKPIDTMPFVKYTKENKKIILDYRNLLIKYMGSK